MNANRQTLYSGPSMLDGTPIKVSITGLAKSSANTKTGDMLQTWIMRTDVEPHKATDEQKESICGDCPIKKACYVKLHHAPLSIYRAEGRAPANEGKAETGVGRYVRLGSYGDPAAVPVAIWDQLLDGATGHTGYTHQWRNRSDLASIVMASTHTPKDVADCNALGFRSFRVKSASEPLLDGEISCPASKEAGAKTTCERCKLCAGAGVKAPNIAINKH